MIYENMLLDFSFIYAVFVLFFKFVLLKLTKTKGWERTWIDSIES